MSVFILCLLNNDKQFSQCTAIVKSTEMQVLCWAVEGPPRYINVLGLGHCRQAYLLLYKPRGVLNIFDLG